MHHHIHHITAVASDPARCTHFYTEILGLRLVKKSVNQDQTEAYHLFFGDETGEAGMDLTFFTFPGAQAGSAGTGSVTTISLGVPSDALAFWRDRFETHQVDHDAITERFDRARLPFRDPDGQRLELVATDALDAENIWTTDEIGADVAIRAFYGATLGVVAADDVLPIITEVLRFTHTDSFEDRMQYSLPDHARGGVLEIDEDPLASPVSPGVGTVHHIAFAVANQAALEEMRLRVRALGLRPTHVIDRHYFQSVYFRTPAGILFELATTGPGFTIDEPKESLGERLSLPPFLEPQRDAIEAQLTPFS